MKALLAFAFLCLSSPAAAVERPLTEFKKLPKSVRDRHQRVFDAAFGFKLDDGVDCTGTFVSSSGHFITALHCVSGCLVKSSAVTREPASADPTSRTPQGTEIYTYRVKVDEGSLKHGLTCKGKIGTKRISARVLMTGGKGWLAPKDTLAAFSVRHPKDYMAALEEGYEHESDFAILQVEESSRTPCVPLASAGPTMKDSLSAISYACVIREDFTARGQTPLFTAGRRTNGFKESEFYKRRGPAGVGFNVESIERPRTFFSTLDVEKCGSGTAILAGATSVVGIATRVYKSTTAYERGSLEAIDVSAVWKDLREKKAAEVAEITACTGAQLPSAR